MKWFGWTHSEHGVTLTEMLMAMATSGILLAAIVSSFVSQQKSYTVQTQIADMTVNARTALDRLTRDIRLAGYGLPEDVRAEWLEQIDWVKGANREPTRFSDPVEISANGTQLRLIGAFDRPFGHITAGAPAGTNRLNITYEEGATKPKPRRHDLVYIGRNELALVTRKRSRKRNTFIEIDTNPDLAGNQGVNWDYSPSHLMNPVELISVITYRVAMDRKNYDTPTPVLKRNTHTGGGAQPLAEYIEDLRFERQGDILELTVTARTAEPDSNYTHPEKKDHYRRLTLTSHVKLRGIKP